jgi:hypothetical protein
MAHGHRQTTPIAWLIAHGLPLDAPCAALGGTAEFAALLAVATGVG